jgi:hypothetical protein
MKREIFAALEIKETPSPSETAVSVPAALPEVQPETAPSTNAEIILTNWDAHDWENETIERNDIQDYSNWMQQFNRVRHQIRKNPTPKEGYKRIAEAYVQSFFPNIFKRTEK